MGTKRSSVNEGIQANSVSADVLAVGRGARATQHVTLDATLRVSLVNQVEQLDGALRNAVPGQPAREVLAEDVAALKTAIERPEPDRQGATRALESLHDKLKMVGVVLADTAELIGPVKAIASALQLTLRFLGL
ncbi:MAG: hypothetical protein OXU20_21740 [Myxococcales bacterium]|nr:hypothetical protein [Myxococcales bacterium]MDD9966968.1 hypothetical protein [Myxococcales bacterium]